MTAFCLEISDADAESSQFLRHMRLDGFERATVPFAERFVLAWQRGAPEPNMDNETLIMVLKVCFSIFTARGSVGITVCGAHMLEQDRALWHQDPRYRLAPGRQQHSQTCASYA